jgi:hypothetical protein
MLDMISLEAQNAQLFPLCGGTPQRNTAGDKFQQSTEHLFNASAHVQRNSSLQARNRAGVWIILGASVILSHPALTISIQSATRASTKVPPR